MNSGQEGYADSENPGPALVKAELDTADTQSQDDVAEVLQRTPDRMIAVDGDDWSSTTRRTPTVRG
jgi:hypothetical protein